MQLPNFKTKQVRKMKFLGIRIFPKERGDPIRKKKKKLDVCPMGKKDEDSTCFTFSYTLEGSVKSTTTPVSFDCKLAIK